MVRRFRADARDIVASLRGELERAVARLETDDAGRIIAGPRARVEALATLEARWSALLIEAGWGDAVARLETDAQRILDRAGVAAAEETGVPELLAGPSEGLVRSALRGQLDGISALAQAAPEHLRDAVLAAEAGPIPREAYMAGLAAALETTFGRAATLVDTAVAGLDRLILMETAAEAGIEWFLYDGPDDNLAREYCAARVGRRLRQAEIDRTENDTGPNPPSRYAGGWNCRHRWVPLAPEEAQEYPRFGP